MKYIILVGDGMGDFPDPGLNGRTPLEAARTPAMDYLARHGEISLLQTVPPGYPPGSDVANLSLLGYLPEKYYTGRAPLEAASLGVDLGADEDGLPKTAFRLNLVTLDQGPDGGLLMVDYSGGHISTPDARVLIEALRRAVSGDRIGIYPGVSYRHLLVLKGDAGVLQTVAPHDYTGRDVTEFWDRYQTSGFKGFMNEARAILTAHEINRRRVKDGRNPANAAWLWGEGRAPEMPTLDEQYGISGALISAVDLLKGIGVYAGLRIINVAGATGYLDTNYEGKVQAARAALQDVDLVFVHVEAPDEASHQGLLPEKIQAIEDFDRKIVQPIMDGLPSDSPFRIAVAMDHFTPLSMKTHVSQPVPVALFDSRQADRDNGMTFCEKNAEAAGARLDNGEIFMKKMLGVT